ncbi:MAG: biopolymer transporter ExbD [candidate division Zixibacteria bacterium]|jgi:biopolymer transport protein ExbD|nr:biopolymer transporter ExbD [candidate division Zixibacteria bacterium]
MSIKKKRRVAIRIDMTPMVDIAFLLLIFYMATTQFKPPEARAVDLPQSHSQIELPDKDVIYVTVTKLDSIYVDYVEKVEIDIDGQKVQTSARIVRTANPETVASEIIRVRTRNPRALVVIKADESASFGVMQDVMKQMQENYMERFLIITDHEAEV